jgi:hypothetical protein
MKKLIPAIIILMSANCFAVDDSIVQKITQYKQEATRYTNEKNYAKACDFWTTSLRMASAYYPDNITEVDYLAKRKSEICNLAQKTAEMELKQTIEQLKPLDNALTCGKLIDVIRSCATAGNIEYCTLVRFGSKYAEVAKRCGK